ncbi:hypothetical protein [Dactylosporangium salmoneum]|uniref:Uncharacterized protein n=1 Tax=Dactylosporangium salmoneum TaxID=53361 RepID=A0ABN3HSE7_9ACTN
MIASARAGAGGTWRAAGPGRRAGRSTYGMHFGQFSAQDFGGPRTKEALRSGRATIGLIFTSDAVFG